MEIEDQVEGIFSILSPWITAKDTPSKTKKDIESKKYQFRKAILKYPDKDAIQEAQKYANWLRKNKKSKASVGQGFANWMTPFGEKWYEHRINVTYGIDSGKMPYVKANRRKVSVWNDILPILWSDDESQKSRYKPGQKTEFNKYIKNLIPQINGDKLILNCPSKADMKFVSTHWDKNIREAMVYTGHENLEVEYRCDESRGT